VAFDCCNGRLDSSQWVLNRGRVLHEPFLYGRRQTPHARQAATELGIATRLYFHSIDKQIGCPREEVFEGPGSDIGQNAVIWGGLYESESYGPPCFGIVVDNLVDLLPGREQRVGALATLQMVSNPIVDQEITHRCLSNDHAFSGGAQAPSAATRG
jgi:hypothetical protein